MVTAPDSEPAAVGVKVTVILHVPPAATLVPQVLVWLNPVPDAATVIPVNEVDILLVSVTGEAVVCCPPELCQSQRCSPKE